MESLNNRTDTAVESFRRDDESKIEALKKSIADFEGQIRDLENIPGFEDDVADAKRALENLRNRLETLDNSN